MQESFIKFIADLLALAIIGVMYFVLGVIVGAILYKVYGFFTED